VLRRQKIERKFARHKKSTGRRAEKTVLGNRGFATETLSQKSALNAEKLFSIEISTTCHLFQQQEQYFVNEKANL